MYSQSLICLSPQIQIIFQIAREAFKKNLKSLIVILRLAQMLKLSFTQSKGFKVSPSFSFEICVRIDIVEKEKGIEKERKNILISPH